MQEEKQIKIFRSETAGLRIDLVIDANQKTHIVVINLNTNAVIDFTFEELEERKEKVIKQEAMDLMFNHIAEKLDLKSGDIDPQQQTTLDRLLKDYITQNTI